MVKYINAVVGGLSLLYGNIVALFHGFFHFVEKSLPALAAIAALIYGGFSYFSGDYTPENIELARRDTVILGLLLFMMYLGIHVFDDHILHQRGGETESTKN